MRVWAWVWISGSLLCGACEPANPSANVEFSYSMGAPHEAHPPHSAAASGSAPQSGLCQAAEDPSLLWSQLAKALKASALPVQTTAQLQTTLNDVVELMPLYCASSAYTGISPLIIAALHYREANNDPTRSVLSGEPIGSRNPDSGMVEGVTLLENAIRAATHFGDNAAEVYGIDVRSSMGWHELAAAALAYNRGFRYCSSVLMHPMSSPYVAAGLTPDLVGMQWPDGDDADRPWGEPSSTRGTTDPRPGFLAFLRGYGETALASPYAWDTAVVDVPCRAILR